MQRMRHLDVVGQLRGSEPDPGRRRANSTRSRPVERCAGDRRRARDGIGRLEVIAEPVTSRGWTSPDRYWAVVGASSTMLLRDGPDHGPRARVRPAPHAASPGHGPQGGDPPASGGRGVAAVARGPGRDRRTPTPACRTGGSRGAAGSRTARYLGEHLEVVTGRRVFDLASGSGLCAIGAMRAGAPAATGADIDPFAAAAIGLNARANGRGSPSCVATCWTALPPEVDVVLAGDCWYEAQARGAGPAVAADRRAFAASTCSWATPGRRYPPD